MTIKVLFIGGDEALIKRDEITNVYENNLEANISLLDNMIYGFGVKKKSFQLNQLIKKLMEEIK